jgi:hypothetical protein
MGNAARLGQIAAACALVLMCAAWSRLGDLEAQIERRIPEDAVKLYNAACAQCRLDRPQRGAAYLIQAVKAGFTDISHLRRDPDLRPLREHPVFRAIVDARQAADEQLARRNLQRWRQALDGGPYRFDDDAERRLTFAWALDEPARADARRRLAALTAHLGAGLFATPSADRSSPRNRLLIVIPTARDAPRLLQQPNAAGVYRHRRRELIAADAKRALRHEFVHALHHDHMDAVGQEHPLWIQEGLALLYEDYRLGDDGSIRFTANDRHDLSRTLAAGNRLLRWRELFAMKPQALRAGAASTYPQLRSIFRFIAREGRLEAWYDAYVDGFEDDPTGVAALELVFGRPVESLERGWRRWLDEQPVTGAGGGG